MVVPQVRNDMLIQARKEQFMVRRGQEVPETNIWLVERLKERASLEAIIAKLEEEQGQDKAVSGAGTSGRVSLMLITNPKPTGDFPIIKPNWRTEQ